VLRGTGRQRTPRSDGRGSRHVHRCRRVGGPPLCYLVGPAAGAPMSELQDLTALIRASTPLIVIETRDEARIVELFRQALMNVWRALYRWSITEGLRRIDMDREDEASGPPDASSVLRMIHEADQRGIYLLLDFHPYLGYASHQRLLRDIVQRRHSQPHVLVLVGAKVELPAELEPLATRFNPRLPDANALLKML